MRIAWFTPLARTSAIGRFSCLVAEELSKTHDVDIWHPRCADLLQAGVRTVAFSALVQFDPGLLAPYDLVVYNLGDNLPFHREIWLASQAAPGILVLHDFVMHHFFAAYYLMHRKSQREYVSAMARLYGERGKGAAEQAFSEMPPLWETDRVIEFPFFEEVLRRAHGVVVHAGFFREKVAASFPGPVRKFSLPYGRRGPCAIATRQELKVPGDSVLLVTVGRVNPNKCVGAVIRAIGQDRDLSSRVFYAVLGACEDAQRKELLTLARDCGVENSVHLPGYVPENRLAAWLTHADVCVNLRCPAMEGGSASVVEEMLYGKAVIVSDSGVYSELPGDCVRKIRSDKEDLGAALLELITDASARRTLGHRAQCFAEEEFRVENYARGFLKLANEVMDAKPLLDVVDRMGDRLVQMGVTPSAGIINKIAGECFSLFCGDTEVSAS